MTARLFAAFVLALALAGCWSGPPLFDSGDAVAAIRDGSYYIREPARAGSPDAPQGLGDDALIVRVQPDNSYSVTTEAADGAEPEVDYRVLAVPLPDVGNGRFVLQVQRRRDQVPDDVGYMLLDTRPSPNRVIILPCSSDVRAAVEGSGGYVARDPNSASQCIFRDKAALLKELHRFMASKAAPDTELELVELTAQR